MYPPTLPSIWTRTNVDDCDHQNPVPHLHLTSIKASPRTEPTVSQEPVQGSVQGPQVQEPVHEPLVQEPLVQEPAQEPVQEPEQQQ
eukprot:SAG31_NODE_11743_length_1002_cov_0.863787_1_plen_85_part_10